MIQFWLIILALATILRLILINQSLWLDEAIQGLALIGRMGPLMTYALADFQPPLYHLIGYLWTQLAGYSEFALRTPSLLSGVATVYFVGKIGELLGGKKVMYFAALLAATNPLLIYYSQEGRTYALTAALVTASMYYYLRLIKQHSLTDYILYSIFTVLFLWSSYLSWFFLASLFVYTLYIKRYDLVKLQIIAALSLVLWLPSFLGSLSIGNSTRTTSPEWGRVVGGLSWKSLPLTWVKFSLGRISFDNKMLYAAIVALVGSVHSLSLRPLVKMRNSKPISPLLVWLIAPILLGVMAASVLPVYQYFRVLFVLPAYLLILAINLSASPRLKISLVATQLLALVYYWATPNLHHEDWRSFVQDIPSSATIAMPSRNQNAPLLYYGISPSQIIEPKTEPINTSPIYYLRYAEELFDTQKLGAKNLVEAGYAITSQRVYPGLALDIYENNN